MCFDVSAEALAILLKTHSIVVSYGPRLPQDPLEHTPPASLFLSQRCQSAAGITPQFPNQRRKNLPDPLSGRPAEAPAYSAFPVSQARRAAAPRPSVTRLICPRPPNCQHQLPKIFNFPINTRHTTEILIRASLVGDLDGPCLVSCGRSSCCSREDEGHYRLPQAKNCDRLSLGVLIMVNELEMSRCHLQGSRSRDARTSAGASGIV